MCDMSYIWSTNFKFNQAWKTRRRTSKYIDQTPPSTRKPTCMYATWKRSCTSPVQFPPSPSMNLQGAIRRCSWMPCPCDVGGEQIASVRKTTGTPIKSNGPFPPTQKPQTQTPFQSNPLPYLRVLLRGAEGHCIHCGILLRLVHAHPRLVDPLARLDGLPVRAGPVRRRREAGCPVVAPRHLRARVCCGVWVGVCTSGDVGLFPPERRRTHQNP